MTPDDFAKGKELLANVTRLARHSAVDPAKIYAFAQAYDWLWTHRAELLRLAQGGLALEALAKRGEQDYAGSVSRVASDDGTWSLRAYDGGRGSYEYGDGATPIAATAALCAALGLEGWERGK